MVSAFQSLAVLCGLPAVGAKRLMHWIAATDLKAQLALQDRIRAFHGKLRSYYNGYLFTGRPYNVKDFARAPVWQD